MMLISGLSMFGIMYLNVFSLDHIDFGLTRLYMTLLMMAPMALIMMGFMWGMYENKKMNLMIVLTSVVVFTLSLYGLRNQTLIDDVQWMKAMIPHHSSAILTSSNADLQDPEVKQLAEEIIEAQEREIAEMKAMIDRLEGE